MTRRVRTILAATDGTASGRLAVVRAASIARETGAVLHAIHVIAADEEPDGPPFAMNDDDPTAGLRRHLARITPRPEVHLRCGTVFEEILELARSVSADLIVAGAHRGSVKRRFFLGTTAGRLARLGDRAVLVVRRPVRGAYRRVLVGVDASTPSENAIVTARAVAPNSTIIPAMVFQVVGESKLRGVADAAAIAELRARVGTQRAHELAGFLEQHAASVETAPAVLVTGDPNERLPRLLGEHRCDLISVGAVGRTNLRHALLGSVAEHVLRDTDGDVLLARQGASERRPT